MAEMMTITLKIKAQISNYGSNVTINGGKGNENISIHNGSYIFLNGGADNDSIYFHDSAENITINGGLGDDYISDYLGNSSSPIFLKYNVGDGNDIIISHNTNDTLMIAGSSYTTTKRNSFYSGNLGLLINVGEGSIKYYGSTAPIIQGTYGGTADTTSINTNSSNITSTTSSTSNFTTLVISGNTYTYNGGNKNINNYQSGAILNFSASYKDWTTDNDDLVINASEGSVRINDAKNKLVKVADSAGNLTANVYLAKDYEGVIDGRGYGAFEVISGSDNVANQIFADAVSSSLWGGRGNSNDDLYGNFGVDEYIYSYGNGNDNIFQAGSEDAINLLNISLEQISGAQISDSGVNLKFNDGGALNISGQVGNFQLGGQNYGADYQNKSWYAK